MLRVRMAETQEVDIIGEFIYHHKYHFLPHKLRKSFDKIHIDLLQGIIKHWQRL